MKEPTKSQCLSEAKRLTDRLGQKGDTKHLAEVLFSHCVSNRHVTETADEAIFRQKMVDGVALRDLAFTVQRRGPKRCANLGDCDRRSRSPVLRRAVFSLRILLHSDLTP